MGHNFDVLIHHPVLLEIEKIEENKKDIGKIYVITVLRLIKRGTMNQ